MKRQTVKAIRLAILDTLRDHQYQDIDQLLHNTPCECPEDAYGFYKAKLQEAWRDLEKGDVLKVHAEHVAWAVAKVLAKEEEA